MNRKLNLEKTNEEPIRIEDVYINKDEEEVIDDNRPYTSLNRKFQPNPYGNLTGLRPYSREKMSMTSSKAFNQHMTQILKDKEYKDNFYKTVKDFQEKEVEFLKKTNKQDHIKKIFSTLNFKSKGSSYNNHFEFDQAKKNLTNERDLTHHFKKSFMKTYEEIKLQSTIIIRK